MKQTPATDLKRVLEKLGAREFEMVALGMDPSRGLAAIAYAQQRGAENPIAYATKVFDDADWQPRGEKATPILNAVVEVRCDTCAGDRFVFVDETKFLYGETVKPCPECNADVNAGFWRVDGSRFEVAK